MAWIAVILALFLFYKFVDRSHKIIFFKNIGIFFVLVTVGTGVYYAYYALTKKPFKSVPSDLRVTFFSHSSKLPYETLTKLANTLFAQLQKEGRIQIKGLNIEEQAYAKSVFYPFVVFKNGIYKKYSETTDEEIDLDFDHAVEKDPTKKDMLKKRLDELSILRLKKYIAELPQLREMQKVEDERIHYQYKLYVRKSWFYSPELKAQFEAALLPDERFAIQAIEAMKDEQGEKMLKAISATNADSEISFEICNDKASSLLSYWFYATGTELGRSTQHGLLGTDNTTRFQGDIIIKPKTCSNVTWTARYTFFDKYKVGNLAGTWEESAQ